jgi:glycosyltransferase involved in cell wall biosynthesis
MSHYAHGLASSLKPYVDVEVIDAADGSTGFFTAARRLRTASRRGATIIATSPHWTLPVMLAWARGRGAHVMHGPLIYMAGRLTRPVYVAYYRLVTRALPVVIVHGERFVPPVRDLRLGERGIVVVPHGFVPDSMIKLGSYDPGGPLICVGRLLPYKGMDVFVQALRIVADRGEPVPAVIGGEGVGPDLVGGTVEGLEILPGKVSDETFGSLVERCSAVVLPYRNATQSGVLAHAFVVGRPVIATTVGSFPEYVVDGQNGYLVAPGDPEALADAIAALRGDPTTASRLAVGARRTWKERLDPDAAARHILEALDD